MGVGEVKRTMLRAVVIVSLFSVVRLDGATITGRVTECCGAGIPARYIVVASEDRLGGPQGDGCRPLTSPPIRLQVGAAQVRGDGTFSITYTPDHPPRTCPFGALVLIEVFTPDARTKLATSPRVPFEETTVLPDLDIGPTDECPVPRIFYSFEAPSAVSGPPGGTVSFEAFVVMTTECGGSFDSGPDAWITNVSAEGGTIVSISRHDTIAASTTDAPPGLLLPCGIALGTVNTTGPFSKPECEDRVAGTSGVSLFQTCDPQVELRLPVGVPQRILLANFQAVIPSGGVPGSCRLFFPNGCQLFANPVDNIAFYLFDRFLVERIDHTVELRPQTTKPLFRRGDFNASGSVDISDAIAGLNFLFLGDDAPPCSDAADSNGDQEVDISDSVALLNFLFVGGQLIPSPGTETCSDSPPSALECASYDRC